MTVEVFWNVTWCQLVNSNYLTWHRIPEGLNVHERRYLTNWQANNFTSLCSNNLVL